MVDLLINSHNPGSARGHPVADSAILKQLIGQQLTVTVQQISALNRSPAPDVLLHTSAQKIQPRLELLLTVDSVDQQKRTTPLSIRAGTNLNFNIGDRLKLDVLPGKRLLLQQWVKTSRTDISQPRLPTKTTTQETISTKTKNTKTNNSAVTASSTAQLPLLTKRIIDALRQTLPRQIHSTELQHTLQKIRGELSTGNIKTTETTPSTKSEIPTDRPKNEFASKASIYTEPSIRETLTRIVRSIPSLQSLADPYQIKNVMRNSGIHFESKLAALSKTAELTATATTQEYDQHNLKQAAHQLLSHDRKGQLLRLVENISQRLIPRSDNTAGKTTQTSHQPRSNTASTSHLLTLQLLPLQQLWQQVISSNKPENRNTGNEEQQALNQLLRFALSNINRVQSTQLQSLIPNSQSNEQTQQSGWIYEIPIWWNEQVDTIWLKVDRESTHSGQSKDVATWRVSLKFDLDSLGELFVIATLQNKSMVASLWASQANTINIISPELTEIKEALEGQGIVVSAMQCHHGKPKHFTQTPSINLLDTRT